MLKQGFKKLEIAKALGKCERSHRKYREFLTEKGQSRAAGRRCFLWCRWRASPAFGLTTPPIPLLEMPCGKALGKCERSHRKYREFLTEKGQRHYAEKSKKQTARVSSSVSPANQSVVTPSAPAIARDSKSCTISGSKAHQSVVAVLDTLEKKLGSFNFRRIFQTITVDNGSEFQDWEGMTRAVDGEGDRTHIMVRNRFLLPPSLADSTESISQ